VGPDRRSARDGPSEENVQGKVCVVTGGGRGLGAATARFLAGEGAAVAICARSEPEVAAVARELAEGGSRVVWGAVDVADEGAVAAFAARVRTTLGPTDVLINNAAILGPVGPLTDLDLRAWKRALDVNVVGTATAMKCFGSHMRGRGGTMVNLSGGGIGGPGVAPSISAYTTSKAAVATLTETVAMELAADDVNVVAIAPGALATTFTDDILTAGPSVAGDALFAATARNRSAPATLEDYFDLLAFVIGDGRWLTGVLLSARWDRRSTLEARRAEIVASSLYRLRRIDADLFHEPPHQ
jgi:NAD(P)-dependent dehydrogenase (short-subunit alcohol dehydrogenase family)